ncbi:MAG: peptidyl-prolyl cis-trans isomerase, partial [Verrucomicrobiota bacterium]
AMEVGEISKVVRTQHGFHIIKLEKKTPSRLMMYEEVREELLEDMMKGKKQERMFFLINRWKQQADIQIKKNDADADA